MYMYVVVTESIKHTNDLGLPPLLLPLSNAAGLFSGWTGGRLSEAAAESEGISTQALYNQKDVNRPIHSREPYIHVHCSFYT